MNCLLCQSTSATERFRATDRLYATTTKRFAVVQCDNCGLLRLNPTPAGAELASFYPRGYWFEPRKTAAGTLEELYRRLLIRDHVAFVGRALHNSGERGPVLDVGCGGGLLLAMLRRKTKARVIGLDVSAEAASLAWRHNGVPAFQGDLTRVPLAPQSCAVLTMFHVVEHLPDPRAYLHAARKLLAPEGRLVLQVPNADCWQFRLLGRRWSGIDIPRHLNDFRARHLELLLDQCGFTVVRRKHFSWRDNPAGLATSLMPALEPVARKVRQLDRSPLASLIKDFAYLALVLASVPFAALEAVAGAGSTIMVEARKS